MKEPFDVARLCQAIDRARLTLRYPRTMLTLMVRQFVGKNWSEEADVKPVPCNLIALYVQIVGKKLVAGNPRVMLTTENHGALPVVDAMQAWCNKEIVKLGLADVLERAVLNALFSVGVVKVGIATPEDAANAAWNLRAGDPFCANIDLDDFVFDIHARDFASASFVGHRYRAPAEVVRKAKHFTKDRLDLTASDDPLFNMEGDERINVLGRGYYGDQQEFEDMVDLWEVYLPRHKVVVTLLSDGAAVLHDKGKALRVQRWLGPDTGPYHILGYGKVPGNPMPKAPVQDLYDLHLHVNNLLRKLMRQAERQKTNTFVSGGADEDGNRVMGSNDGEILRVDHPDLIKEVTTGGPNQANFQLFGAMKDMFVWLAGNLNALGGLAPEAKTATQDKMLEASSSATISVMQDATIDFTSKILKSLCWYWHHHPQKVMTSRLEVEGLPEVAVSRQVHPPGAGVGPDGQRRMSRDHDFDDMDVQVDPYSMPRTTPQQKLAALNQIVTTIIIPMIQQLQAQGVAFDPAEWLQLVGKYANMPELKQILTMQEPPTEGELPESAPQGPTKPAETTRNYTRHSQSNPTPAGMDLQRANAMKNGQPQGAQ